MGFKSILSYDIPNSRLDDFDEEEDDDFLDDGDED